MQKQGTYQPDDQADDHILGQGEINDTDDAGKDDGGRDQQGEHQSAGGPADEKINAQKECDKIRVSH